MRKTMQNEEVGSQHPPLIEHAALLPCTAKHHFSQFEANQNKTKTKKKNAESVQECSNRQRTVKKEDENRCRPEGYFRSHQKNRTENKTGKTVAVLRVRGSPTYQLRTKWV